MRQCFILLLTIIVTAGASAQAVTKNGKITSTGTEYVSKNGTVGAAFGVDKNGKIQAAATPLVVGSDYQGGKIFYLFVAGDPGYVAGQTHGLIAATADIATVTWGCVNTGITGTVTGIGYGNANTLLIVAGCTTAGIPAKLCNDLVLNTYSDWYLPSGDELTILLQNSALIGGFPDAYAAYFSSTEDNANNYNRNNFAKGGSTTNPVVYNCYKGSVGAVRPVRTF